VTVVVLSTGDVEENRRKAEDHGLSSILLQESFEVLDQYGGGGTPSAISLTGDGIVDSELTEGTQGVRDVLNQIMQNRVRAMWEAATGEELDVPDPGLPVGTEVPDLTVPGGVEGIGVRLRNLVEGRRSVLLFWSATCGFCDAILPDVRVEEDGWLGSEHSQMVFFVSSPFDMNEGLGFRSRIILDPAFEIGNEFGVTGTPSALVVEPDGTVGSKVAVGTDEVLELLRREKPRSRDGAARSQGGEG
jgi:hypothetical protein